MLFRRRKRILKQLRTSFGQVKNEGFNFEIIKRYYTNKDNSHAFQELSDQTCNDLDFDLFFAYIDRTNSKIGQQFLYNKLRVLSPSKAEFEIQEEIIRHHEEHPNERLNIQYLLGRLNHYDALYLPDLFQKKMELKPKWHFIFPLITGTIIFSFLLAVFNPSLILIPLCLFPVNVVVHYAMKRRTRLFLSSVPVLLILGTVAKKLYKKKHLKVISPKLDDSLATIDSIRRKVSIFKLEQKLDSDLESIFWFILEIIKIQFLLEPLLFYSALDKIRGRSKEIEEVFVFVGKVDTCISIASLRKSQDVYCLPNIIDDSSKLEFKNIRHPLVPSCVTNSINSQKSILITGSNMSGKTTFIRSIGLNLISGLTLNTCFAEKAIVPKAEIHSVIRIEDDLISSTSYFYKEVDEIKKILQTADKYPHSIILLDELFKGTNTIERIASAYAVLSYLEKQGSQVFVSTHDIELTGMLNDQFELFHFTESISDSTIHFDYKLKKGILEQGNAIRILEINDYPKSIVKSANEIVSKIKRG